MKQVLPVFHGIYIRTVSTQLHFSFDTTDPFLTQAKMAKMASMVHVVLLKRPNQPV